jgi:hypothetical protein
MYSLHFSQKYQARAALLKYFSGCYIIKEASGSSSLLCDTRGGRDMFTLARFDLCVFAGDRISRTGAGEAKEGRVFRYS